MSRPLQLFFWSGPPRFLLVNHRVVLHSPEPKPQQKQSSRCLGHHGVHFPVLLLHSLSPVLPDELGYGDKITRSIPVYGLHLGRAWVVFLGAASAALPNPAREAHETIRSINEEA